MTYLYIDMFDEKLFQFSRRLHVMYSICSSASLISRVGGMVWSDVVYEQMSISDL